MTSTTTVPGETPGTHDEARGPVPTELPALVDYLRALPALDRYGSDIVVELGDKLGADDRACRLIDEAIETIRHEDRIDVARETLRAQLAEATAMADEASCTLAELRSDGDTSPVTAAAEAAAEKYADGHGRAAAVEAYDRVLAEAAEDGNGRRGPGCVPGFSGDGWAPHTRTCPVAQELAAAEWEQGCAASDRDHGAAEAAQDGGQR